jgi:cell division protein FtsL
MSKIEKIKRVILIIVGLTLSAYLIYSGVEILNYEQNNQNKVAK